MLEIIFQVALTVLGALILVPLAIRGVEQLDERIARGLERLFGVFKRRK